MNAHIGVEYKEFGNNYKGVRIDFTQGNKKSKKFRTDNFPDDFMSAKIYLMHADEINCSFFSSSVDHFTMDSKKKYSWRKNEVFGEYPVLTKNAKEKWDRLSVERTIEEGHRDLYVLNYGSVAVLDRTEGQYRIVTPDGNKEVQSDNVNKVLEQAEKLKKKIVWE
jgi:hypothetical protein